MNANFDQLHHITKGWVPTLCLFGERKYLTKVFLAILGMLNKVRKFEVRFINSHSNSFFRYSLFSLCQSLRDVHSISHIVCISIAWL